MSSSYAVEKFRLVVDVDVVININRAIAARSLPLAVAVVAAATEAACCELLSKVARTMVGVRIIFLCVCLPLDNAFISCNKFLFDLIRPVLDLLPFK